MAVSREERAQKQKELLCKYGKTLVCFTLNIAGDIKNSPLIYQGFIEGNNEIERVFASRDIDVIHSEKKCLFTGCEAYYIVNAPAYTIKKLMCKIEETHPIGRLFDIDVINCQGVKIQRSDAGYEKRKCLICSSHAAECARSRAHGIDELKSQTTKILLQYLLPIQKQKVADFAIKALLYELSVTPKPGLVDMDNNGSHRDMDRFVFINSALSLRKYFEECFEIGYATKNTECEKVMNCLKVAGKKAECEMYKATNGVNTHKGAVFSLGLIASCCGRLAFTSFDKDDLISECSTLYGSIVQNELNGTGKELSYGEKCYKEYGIKGARGQAAEGYKSVLDGAYEVLKHCLHSGFGINHSGGIALLYLIRDIDDTALLHRAGIKGAMKVRKKITDILLNNPYPDIGTIKRIDDFFIKRGYSSGGAADMLSLCFFVYFVTEEGNNV